MNPQNTTAAICVSIVALLAVGCSTNDKPSDSSVTVNDKQSESAPFIDAQHPLSRRFAIFEDSGTSAWLYLTEPDTEKPSADAWVYNRIPAPS
ncbi:hypothetical protein ACFL2H_11385, partial [Planctomycetota bacterium]